MPRLPVAVASAPAARGQTQTSAPGVRRLLEPAGVEQQKNDRQAKVHAMLLRPPRPERREEIPIPRPPPPPAVAGSAFSQSLGSVVLGTTTGSILPAPITMMIASGAQKANLLGAVTPIPGAADTTYTWLLLIDGVPVAKLVSKPGAVEGLSFPINYSAALAPGPHVFDLHAIVNSTTDAPEASGTLTVLVTP